MQYLRYYCLGVKKYVILQIDSRHNSYQSFMNKNQNKLNTQ